MIRSPMLASLALAALVAPPMIAKLAAATTTNCDGDTGVCTQTTCKVDDMGNTACVTATLPGPQRERTPPKKEQRQLACGAREGERQWVEYCAPKVYVDAEGVSRYRYGNPGCGGAVLSAHNVRAPWLTEPFEQKCLLDASDR